MMKEELGLIEDEKRPIDSSISTFIGFNLVGLIPFMLYVLIGTISNPDAFAYSTIMVATAFFMVGIIKGKIVKKSKIMSSLFTLMIGGVAAIVAYLLGSGLNFLIH
jgi:VIT1/CCC1 family predicted Fe2+/Mn2+ transporter